ncbi:MAG: hypothetical protein HGA47_00130 [Zoogloea sp.]|nr:hypothetical protein [Zoogloea sp.]
MKNEPAHQPDRAKQIEDAIAVLRREIGGTGAFLLIEDRAGLVELSYGDDNLTTLRLMAHQLPPATDSLRTLAQLGASYTQPEPATGLESPYRMEY